jgi:hypothetical protein
LHGYRTKGIALESLQQGFRGNALHLPIPMEETLKHASKVLDNAMEKTLVLQPEGVKIIVNAVVSKKVKQYIVDLEKVSIITDIIFRSFNVM